MVHGIPPIAYGPHWHGMYKKIKILQESSTALNFQRKARVQCAYRKMQNKCIYKKQEQNKKEEKQTEHTRIPQLPHHGQSCNLKIKIKKKIAKQQREKDVGRLLTVPSTYKHIITWAYGKAKKKKKN